jgi:hypothetical protein
MVVQYLDFDSYLHLRTTSRTAYSEFILYRYICHLLQVGDRRALRLAVYYQLPEGVIRYHIRDRHDLLVAWRWYTLLCARVFGVQPVIDPHTWRGMGEYTESSCMALGFGCQVMSECKLTWELLADHHWIPTVSWPAICQIHFALPTSTASLKFLQGLARCLETRLAARYDKYPEHYDTIIGQLEWLANLHPPYQMGTLIHLLPHAGPHLAAILRRTYELNNPESWAWMRVYLGEIPIHILDWIPANETEVLVCMVRRLIVQIYQRASIQLHYEDHIQDPGYVHLKSYMQSRGWLWPVVGDSLDCCRRGQNFVDVFWSRLVE